MSRRPRRPHPGFKAKVALAATAMGDDPEIFVGIDVAKVRNAIAIADGERGGEVRFLGEVDEAGPTGYGLHRLITSLGHSCIVVAPSLVPRRPGDQVKTNRRDAISLAKLLRAGELTAVWVPCPTSAFLAGLEPDARCKIGTPRDYTRKCGTQSAHQSLITDVLQVPLPPVRDHLFRAAR